ncbi:MAG: UDP-N-acetyl-D-glucosamine 2-epimerase, UDP-hydrolysing [Chloroflexi bacterium RBG_19FT_COMBO_47_15]|jgi:UDP-N-acetylglucosamine 2-epimerase (non-hydrolysing)/GDP/UDP-N,N'-diacetylbacillosamine 2-epimerase (hydrolysing)|nr:MAG: UDP-N-acetyl-D-glucosamine 2-epimerase, UDP-hydrolysing [Chloroflexi bacterium RBG_19FT_COMBO_47_15]
MKRKVAVVTGTRAEYGALYPVLKAIEQHPKLQLLLIATGMHLSHEFGYTVRELEKDGFHIDARVDMLLSNDTLLAMSKSIGIGIMGLAQTWEQIQPDVIVVLGDRVEPLAAAIAGSYMNIPVAHIHGGDTGKGGLDESARHAITKFAHIHFPATKESAERIIGMGEDRWRVHTVGSPALDAILNEPLLPPKIIAKKLGLDLSRPVILVVQHPVTTQVEEAPEQMRETLEAIVEIGYPTVLIYPNSDAGGRRMIGIIKEYDKHPFIKTFKSLPRKEYLSIMKISSVMVGNSSSGIIDAPSFGLPVVNVGIRQEGRERGKNVIDVAHKESDIARALKRALSDKKFLREVKKCENPYGDGRAGPRIVEALSQIAITPRLLQKKSTY